MLPLGPLLVDPIRAAFLLLGALASLALLTTLVASLVGGLASPLLHLLTLGALLALIGLSPRSLVALLTGPVLPRGPLLLLTLLAGLVGGLPPPLLVLIPLRALLAVLGLAASPLVALPRPLLR